MLTRKEYEKEEDKRLASYAIRSRDSQGRKYPEEEHPLRTAFQRDRDRIIHSTSFRRLEYKTQVYITHEGDYYRTRLTHTLEVSQIARTISRILRLNEDLTEAIALGHDLGHTPFGHAGEYVLRDLMLKHGGFEHNRQGLRTVDYLEEKYPQFPGLNLTYEVREGILKHAVFDENGNPAKGKESHKRKQPTLECQVVDISDEIAYNSHDLDDALQQGLIQPEDLESIELWKENYEDVFRSMPDISLQYAKFETIKRLINLQVFSVVEQTEKNVLEKLFTSPEDIRLSDQPTAAFAADIKKKIVVLQKFLMERVYRHPLVTQRNEKANSILSGLFDAYHGNHGLLPAEFQARLAKDIPEQVISDYIAMMTDRFAIAEHNRLFGTTD